MTVNIFISETANGSSLADTADLGSSSPGESSTYQDLFISHDAEVASITDCALYIYRYTGSNYEGSDADADITEFLGWGDAATGGIKLVMDGWESWTSGINEDGTWLTIKNGYGDVTAPLPLLPDSIVVGSYGSIGEIPVGSIAHVQIKVDVPSSVPRGADTRMFGITMSFSATS